MATSNSVSNDGLKIIHAGLFRMGTYSMAKAYRILGFETFHALDDPMHVDWALLEKAAEATWPSGPNARPPFKREDWDKLWGERYDAVCDTSGPFTLELFKAYPDAKVVIVQRDFDSWWPSFQTETVDNLFMPLFNLQIFLAWHLVGYRGGQAMRKLIFGFFNAETKTQIEANGRKIYDKFYRDIRSTVPPEKLLEYKMGSGWAPLCEFLGTDIPEAPFPFSNDRKEHSEGIETRRWTVLLAAAKNAVLGATGLIVVIGSVSWLLWN